MLRLFSALASAVARLLRGSSVRPAPPESRDSRGAGDARDSHHPPEALTPDELRLAEAAGVAPRAALALRRHGRDLQRLMGRDAESFDEVPAPGLTVGVGQEGALAAVRALRDRLPAGYVVFRSELNFGRGDDRVAVLRADDPYGPLRGMGTNGANFDIETDDVIVRLREWDARFGLRIVGAALDWVEAEFVRPPDDILAFAHEVYEFCPDVVDQGCETVEALAEEMGRTNTLYLWWD